MTATIRTPARPSHSELLATRNADRHTQGQLGKVRLTCNFELEAKQDRAPP